MRMTLLLLALLLSGQPLAAQDIAPTEAKTPDDERKSFRVPAGFEVQLVASEPGIQKPMQIAFDAKGRLWVTTSHHYPFPAEAGQAKDRLYVLSDFDATGRAKRIEVFDDQLNIPIGILPLPDCRSAIVSSVGQILKLTDTDGDGKADRREVLFTGFGTRDTHGMVNSFTLMPDGWVHACHGYLNQSKVKGKDGHEVEMQSGHTFRFRPDGSRIEVFTKGQVNPFGMTIDPWGNLYTADCHTKPITQLIRGACYDSFGKPHDGLGYAPHVTRHDHGSTALCGLAWYEAPQFPADYRGCMFLGNVITNRVNADKIVWKGSTPEAKEMPDFLVSSDPWFRPTDIKLGPDGALYVADFYNRIIGHYEVDLRHPLRDKDRGRVWRIVAKGADARNAFTDWTNASPDVLAAGFTNPNIAVRHTAALEYLRRKSADRSLELPLKLERLDTTSIGLVAIIGETVKDPSFKPDDYRKVFDDVRKQLQESPGEFTGHVIRAMTSRAEWGPVERGVAIDCLTVPKALAVHRAAIDGMTAHPHAEFIAPLVNYLPGISTEDTHGRHAARVALRNALQSAQTWPDNVPADILLGIAEPRAAAALLKQFDRVKDNSAALEHLGRWAKTGETDECAVKLKGDAVGLLSLARGAQLRNHRLPDAVVIPTCLAGLSAPRSPAAPAALELVAMSRSPLLFDATAAVVSETGRDPVQRAAALSAIVAIDPKRAEPIAIRHLGDTGSPVALRERAAQLVGAMNSAASRDRLADTLANAEGRLALPVAQALAGSREGGERLLADIASGKASARLLQEKSVLDRLRAARVPDWETRVKTLTANLPAADARLTRLVQQRAAAFARAQTNAENGKTLFTKNCAACHKLGEQGGKIGPNLDGMGNRGVSRLLEDILDPNRNVDANFRSTQFTMADGRIITGLFLRDVGGIAIYADANGEEQRLAHKDMESKRVTAQSPMPADWADRLKPEELNDLLAFLLTLKATPAK